MHRTLGGLRNSGQRMHLQREFFIYAAIFGELITTYL